MSDQFITVNSDDNITYTCTIEAGSTVVWEVERSQIRSEDQFNDIYYTGVRVYNILLYMIMYLFAVSSLIIFVKLCTPN